MVGPTNAVGIHRLDVESRLMENSLGVGHMRIVILIIGLVCSFAGAQEFAQAQAPFYGSPYGAPNQGNAHMHHGHHGSTQGAWSHSGMPNAHIAPQGGNGWSNYPNANYCPNYPISPAPSLPPGYFNSQPYPRAHNWHPGHYLLGY